MFWIILTLGILGGWMCYMQQVNEANALIGTETRRQNNEELARKRLTYKCVSAKLKNVYKTYQDTSQTNCDLCVYDDRLAYIDTLSTIEQFSIPLESITGVQCDTFERLTVGRLIAIGILAFALKKKDYCIVVSYIDSSTGTEEQLLFKTNKKHDVFVNNVIIARNSCRG